MPQEQRPRLSFVGAGVVGTALATRLREQGYPVVAVASRSPASAAALAERLPGCQVVEVAEAALVADLVFITTPDDAIVAATAAVHWRPGVAAVHCSGAASTAVLESARQSGADVGGFHPLQSFATLVEALQNLPGSTFALEAEEPLLAVLQEMAGALGGTWLRLTADDKLLYHAAAVIVSNYTVGLMKMATDLWQQFGVPPERATSALLPLLRGTVNNIATVGLPRCLTGPVARGDVGTVERHVDALRQLAPSVLPAYCELGRQILPVALAKGRLGEAAAAALAVALDPLVAAGKREVTSTK